MNLAVRARRTVAALVTLSLLASMALAGWHRATVVHGRCAEHGEEIDLQRVATPVAVPATSVRSSIAASDWVRVHDHEHCELLAAAHAPAAVALAAPLHHAPIAHDAPALPIDALAPATAALYRLAPKTSPPA